MNSIRHGVLIAALAVVASANAATLTEDFWRYRRADILESPRGSEAGRRPFAGQGPTIQVPLNIDAGGTITAIVGSTRNICSQVAKISWLPTGQVVTNWSSGNISVDWDQPTWDKIRDVQLGVDLQTSPWGQIALVATNGTGTIAAVRQGGSALLRLTPVPHREAIIVEMDPPPVRRQLPNTYGQIEIVLEDGTASAVRVDSITMSFDGHRVRPAVQRTGKRTVVQWAPTGVVLAGDQHVVTLSYRDSRGRPTCMGWVVMNLENLAPLAPATMVETFDRVSGGSVPNGWFPFDFSTTVTPGFDLGDGQSDAYKGWLTVERALLQMYSETDTNTPDVGNLLVASSERAGDCAQFVTTSKFDCRRLRDVVVTMDVFEDAALNSLTAIEYSIDGGRRWLPATYRLSPYDIYLRESGEVDVHKTLNTPHASLPVWADTTQPNNYASAVAAAQTPPLGLCIVPRLGVARETIALRLPQAGGRSDVRLRLAHIGKNAGFVAIDNIAFRNGPPRSLLFALECDSRNP